MPHGIDANRGVDLFSRLKRNAGFVQSETSASQCSRDTCLHGNGNASDDSGWSGSPLRLFILLYIRDLQQKHGHTRTTPKWRGALRSPDEMFNPCFNRLSNSSCYPDGAGNLRARTSPNCSHGFPSSVSGHTQDGGEMMTRHQAVDSPLFPTPERAVCYGDRTHQPSHWWLTKSRKGGVSRMTACGDVSTF